MDSWSDATLLAIAAIITSLSSLVWAFRRERHSRDD